MIDSFLQQKIDKKSIRCLGCAHYCILKNNQFGKCAVRQNIGGKIVSHNYQKVSSLQVDPIEKKPLYHFLPGTKTLSIGSFGCSFKCLNCQNWQISQSNNQDLYQTISAKKIVEIAKKEKIKSISYTYNEPIIFSDYALEIMIEAKKNGIKNIWVSNGFFSDELFEVVSPFIDAINIDLKSFSEKFYQDKIGGSIGPVLKTIEKFFKRKIWLEITTLLIPQENDDFKNLTEISNYISRVSTDIPWHITGFSSTISWKMKDKENTSVASLENSYQIAKKSGLKFVYLGNIISEKNNTYCPNCNFLLIKRQNQIIKKIEEDFCPNCNQKIKIII